MIFDHEFLTIIVIDMTDADGVPVMTVAITDATVRIAKGLIDPWNTLWLVIYELTRLLRLMTLGKDS